MHSKLISTEFIKKSVDVPLVVDVIKPLRCYAINLTPYAARLMPYVKLTRVITTLDGFLGP